MIIIVANSNLSKLQAQNMRHNQWKKNDREKPTWTSENKKTTAGTQATLNTEIELSTTCD